MWYSHTCANGGDDSTMMAHTLLYDGYDGMSRTRVENKKKYRENIFFKTSREKVGPPFYCHIHH